jgi:hypothetical protein
MAGTKPGHDDNAITRQRRTNQTNAASSSASTFTIISISRQSMKA